MRPGRGAKTVCDRFQRIGMLRGGPPGRRELVEDSGPPEGWGRTDGEAKKEVREKKGLKRCG